jgi:membrane associated rhomboid family serine protease
MFALWIFGPLVEQQLGRKRYLAFYLVCGIFGGLMYLVLNLVGSLGVAMPGALRVEIHTPLVGASAGVFGVLMACAYIAPRAIVRLLFPPIALQMRWFVYGYFVIALWNLLREGNNQGGDAAHVGGALAGYFFIRRPHLLRDFFDILGDSRKKPERHAPARAAGEIDAILDKINRDGLGALSEAEKRTLAEHSRRERGR